MGADAGVLHTVNGDNMSEIPCGCISSGHLIRARVPPFALGQELTH